MATNPDELLIFKLRGMEPKKEEKKKEVKSEAAVAKPAIKPTPEATPKQTAPQFQFFKPKAQEAAQPTVQAKQEAAPPKVVAQARQSEQPRPQIIKPKVIVQGNAPIPEQRTQEAAKPSRPFFSSMFTKQVEEQNTISTASKKRDEEALVSSMLQTRQPAAQREETSAATQFGKRSADRGEAESIKAAKSLNCVTHPWRPAYAICEYCDRPFCYADLIEYGDKFYCLEDVDKATTGTHVTKRKSVSIFTRAASALFLVNSAILGYYVAPQMSFIISYLTGNEASTVLGTLSYTYSIPIFNLLMTIIGVFGAVLMLISDDERAFYLSGLIGTVILIGASSEYLNSSFLVYLLAVSVISLLTICLLAYGRISNSSTTYASDIGPSDIEWPRIETF